MYITNEESRQFNPPFYMNPTLADCLVRMHMYHMQLDFPPRV